MAEPRNIVTTVSVVVALLACGWAIYATKRADKPSFAPMGGAPGATMNRPGGAAPGGAVAATRGAGPGGGPPGGGMPVSVVTAEARDELVTREVQAIGTAVANESVEITSKVSNLVTAVRFRDGQSVARGQVLVELDGAQARAELAVAEAALADSASQLARSSELRATRVISDAQYEQLEAAQKGDEARVAAARARVADTVIRAPFAGRVGLRRVSVGSLVSPGAVITTLDDTSVMKVDFSVPENLLGGLREGLPVTARSTAFPEREFSGKVLSLDSRVDPTTRSVIVRATVQNAGGLLKPGMFLNVALAKEERNVLLIPEEALVPEQSRQYVFVVRGDKVERREVQIGRRDPGSVEIAAGLAAGDRVIIEGTQKVRDGSTVRDLSASRETVARQGSPEATS
jgi:membrane fusion protein (multidrug efflux system)